MLALAAPPVPSSTRSSQAAKVSVVNRVLAKGIDLMGVALCAAVLPYPFGPLLGFFYSLLGDGMRFGPFRGQSIGKKLLKLRTVSLSRAGAPANLRDSLFRNAPVGVATFFAIIPVWGWFILILVGLPLMVIEVYLMLSVESGHRLGDVMGDTSVVESRESRI